MNVILSPSYVDTFTRPEFYGTPAYFGKVEWFDVFDRQTNELLDWRVSRIDGKECVAQHPSEGIHPAHYSLSSAAEQINAIRIPEVRARLLAQ